MSILSWVRRVRLVLLAGVVARALAWGVVAGVSLLLSVGVVDHFAVLAVATRVRLLEVAAVSAVLVFLAIVWRDRAARSMERVALWIEEQQPSLRFGLVSALELNDERLMPRAEPRIWTRIAVRRAARGLTIPAAAAASAVLITLLLPTGAVARLRDPHAGDALDFVGARSPDATRLAPLVARVTPPAYSGRRPESLDDPSDLRALVGSAVVLEGRTSSAEPITAAAGADTLRATIAGDRWTIAFHVTAAPLALRLTDRSHQRVLAVEPVADLPPTITLTSPSGDSVLRQPRGAIALAANATDDIAVAGASFEYVVSSGEGENFTFKSGTLGAVKPNAPNASLTATLNLASLGLKPGDVVHVRAVAKDANDLGGPGVGASETRTIRIARRDEYDSVAVDAAAPAEADKSAISERMLVTLAEALEKRRPSLSRDTVVRESRAIALDQRRLRSSVSEIVFGTTDSVTAVSASPIDFEDEGDPTRIVNKPLLEAYNAMWDASTALETGEPGVALPHMRRALAALERARQAERLYLRGRPPQVVIDLSKIRLKGTDKGAASTRRPRNVADDAQHALADRFLGVLGLIARDAGAAADSLLVLRIDALPVNAPFAEALGQSAEAIRRNRTIDAAAALLRARRALAGVPIVRDSIGRWSVVP